MTPLDFLSTLWQFKPEEQFILIWTLPDKRSHWFQSVPAAAEFVGTLTERDVYVGVGLAGKNYGPTHRCVSGEITGISGLASDFDFLSDAHSNKALPRTIEQALQIVPPGLPPSLVILTGNGAHCWWLFKEPYVFDSDEERKEVQRIVMRFHTMLRLRASQFVLAYDRLADLARVLRVAPSKNYKDRANPKDVVVHSFIERRYNLSEIEEFLDESGTPDPDAEEKAAREWAEQFADKPLIIDQNARIPQEMLDGWMAADMRFRNTWLRQRHDLEDQSQSGYDLALADFGMMAGLNEQQIVDLIVHHRAESSQRSRTRVDYYQRTIAKASRWNRDPIAVLATPLPAAPGAPEPAPTTGNPAPPGAQDAPREAGSRNHASPDPATARALLCQRISEILGVRICRLVKFTGKEPTFHMEMEETKIEFPNVGKLISQESVRLAIAGSIGKLIRKLKPKVWEQLAQVMLDACIVEPGGEETEWEGAARLYVSHYLSETGFIDTLEGQQVQNQRKPILLDGKVAICASDLQLYVNKTTFQNLSIKAVASMLGVLGGKSVRVRGAKFKEQSRWILPVDQFDPAEYSPHREDTRAQ
jgi:hypothetical protein